MKTILHIFNSNHFSGLEKVACDIIQNTSDQYHEVYVTKDGPIIEVLKEKQIEKKLKKKLKKFLEKKLKKNKYLKM